MYLENVVVDATDPRAVGRFWEAALGTEPLTDEPAGYETRLAVPDGPVLDLCFQQVGEPPTGPHRLHLAVAGGEDLGAVTERLVGLGASRGDESGTTLLDPGGNPFRVVRPQPDHDEGAVAALSLAVADPTGAQAFWAWLSGWAPVEVAGGPALRHPSGRGPVLELRPEDEPKNGKSRMHLDLRLEQGDDVDALASEITGRGGREVLHPEWGTLPWRFFEDPSGNEFCLLPAPR